MRRRLRSESIRNRFKTAWNYLPRHVQNTLRAFIRYVREVPTIAGSKLYVRDSTTGCREIIDGPLDEGTGYTFYGDLGTRKICDVLLPTKPLAQYPNGDAIAIILHELAHAYDYALHHREVANRSDYESERLAWDQAAKWAAATERDPELLKQIEEYAVKAMRCDFYGELERIINTLAEP